MQIVNRRYKVNYEIYVQDYFCLQDKIKQAMISIDNSSMWNTDHALKYVYIE
jgi:hypothetical protein